MSGNPHSHVFWNDLVRAKYDRHRGRAFACQRRLRRYRRVRAIGRHKVDDRLWMFKILGKVDPTRVRLELSVASHAVKFFACVIERWDPSIATAGHVDRGQIERQTHEIVA